MVGTNPRVTGKLIIVLSRSWQAKIYKDIVLLPVAERERLFSLIARKGFDKDDYTYDEVFGGIPSPLTIEESSEYLKVAEVTVRRWAKKGKLPFHKVGKLCLSCG